MQIKVSLIIPVFNVEEYLDKCLLSAINQTLYDIEIIIINDGSTDNSLLICNKYQKKDKRIHIITQENAGLSAARNTGINHAKGEFIVFLDSDDDIEIETLEKAYTKAHQEKLDIVVYRYNQVDNDGNIKFTNKIKDNYTQDELLRRVLSVKQSPMACNKLYKTELFKKYHIYFPVGLLHEDVYTTYKLVFFAQKIGIIEEAFYNWLIRPGSISKNISPKHIEDILNSIPDMKLFLRENNVFDKYEAEYIRRGYSFALLMIDKIGKSNDSKLNKTKLKKLVWFKLKRLDLLNDNTLNRLKEIDLSLYKHYKNIEEKSLFRKATNRLLPIGSKRRKYIK
jgi:glycosyltransferase involved in cell wall biosynthesis